MLTVLSVKEAQECIINSLKKRVAASETVSIKEALGRVAAAEIKAPEMVPSFPRATMDGFAVKSADTFGASESMPALLTLKGEVLMGEKPDRSIKAGEAMRIPTGGMLPLNSDSVSMLEYSEILGDQLNVYRPVAPFENTIQIGDDFQIGTPVIGAGQLLRPQEIGILAALGLLQLKVYQRPRVFLFSTGDELIAPEKKPVPGQIRDINGPLLAAQILKSGGLPVYQGIITDQTKELEIALLQSLPEADLIVISGGSSVGSRDVTAKVIDGLPGEGILFHGVSMRPGKPAIYGLSEGRPVFGLSGNPVSAMFSFLLFVRPVLRYLQGLPPFLPFPPSLIAYLDTNLSSPGGREDYVRVKLYRDKVEKSTETLLMASPIFGGPGLLNPVLKGDGYFIIPRDVEGLTKGSKVIIYLI